MSWGCDPAAAPEVMLVCRAETPQAPAQEGFVGVFVRPNSWETAGGAWLQGCGDATAPELCLISNFLIERRKHICKTELVVRLELALRRTMMMVGEFWGRMTVGHRPRLRLHQRGRHCLGIGVSLRGCTGCSASDAAFMSGHGLCSWAV